jgi:hypothetical protein
VLYGMWIAVLVTICLFYSQPIRILTVPFLFFFRCRSQGFSFYHALMFFSNRQIQTPIIYATSTTFLPLRINEGQSSSCITNIVPCFWRETDSDYSPAFVNHDSFNLIIGQGFRSRVFSEESRVFAEKAHTLSEERRVDSTVSRVFTEKNPCFERGKPVL